MGIGFESHSNFDCEIDGVVPVHKEFYLRASDMYKAEGDHANYYQSNGRCCSTCQDQS